MRAIHVSDTHGHFKDLQGYAEIVVHSGDFCPDLFAFHAGHLNKVANEQEAWLLKKSAFIKKWLNGKPFYFVLGNHDFINPVRFEEILKSVGIDAHNLTEKVVSYGSVNFYGFPYIPYINGQFSYECNSNQMADRIDAMVAVSQVSYLDVIVAHSPPRGCLDYCFHQYESFGNIGLSNALDYKWDENTLPQAILCGHIHASHGTTIRGGVLISNAATSQNIVEI